MWDPIISAFPAAEPWRRQRLRPGPGVPCSAVGRGGTRRCEGAAPARPGGAGTGRVFLLSCSTWRAPGARSELCSRLCQCGRALLLESWGEHGKWFLVIAGPYEIEVWRFLLEQLSVPKSCPAPACTARGWSASKGRDVLQDTVSLWWQWGVVLACDDAPL